MKRGVVFSPCEIISNEQKTGFHTGKGLNIVELNYLTLYWDRLISPTNNLMGIRLPKETDLIDCGILERPRYAVQGPLHSDGMAEFYAEIHAVTLDKLRRVEPETDWRMHFLNDEISISPDQAQIKTTLRFELDKLLPVPGETVPLHEILEFKQRRSAELLSLHSYLDELYQEVINSADFDLQKAKALSGLKNSVADLDKLNAEQWRSPIKFSISSSFEFNLTQVVTALGTGLEAFKSDSIGEALSYGTVAAILGGFIKVKPERQAILKNGDVRIAYLTKAKNEGIV